MVLLTIPEFLQVIPRLLAMINGNNCYLLEMSIGKILEENRQILHGYLEYINRDHTIKLITGDMEFSTILKSVRH